MKKTAALITEMRLLPRRFPTQGNLSDCLRLFFKAVTVIFAALVFSVLHGCSVDQGKVVWSNGSVVAQAPAPVFSEAGALPSLWLLATSTDGSAQAVLGERNFAMWSDDSGRHWKKASVPPPRAENGMLESAVVAPDGTFVAVGGAGETVRSVDGGKTWVRAESQATSSSLEVVIVSPKGALLAAASDGSIFRSTDSGRYWVNTGNSKGSKGLHDLRSSASVIVAAGDESILYSIDDGVTWRQVAMETSENFGKITLLRSGAFMLFQSNGSVLKSVDKDASTWRETKTNLTNALHDIRLLPNGDLIGLTYSGSDSVIQRSSNEGTTWESFSSALADPIFNLGVDGRGRALAISWNRMSYSDDGGKHWTAVPDSGFRGSLEQIYVDPKNDFVILGRGGVILRSEDGGASWSRPVNSGPGEGIRDVAQPEHGTLVTVGDRGSIGRSTDGGVTWLDIPQTATDQFLSRVIVAPSGGLVAVGAHGTIIRSTDRGITWASAEHVDTQQDIADLTVTRRGTLVAVGKKGVILRSEDMGRTWTRAPNDSDATLTGVVAAEDAVVAVGEHSTVTRSTDDGKLWHATQLGADRMTLQRPTLVAKNVLISPGSGGTIARSGDLGVSWSLFKTSTDQPLHTALQEKNGAVVIIGSAGQVMLSLDQGRKWVSVPVPASAASGSLNAIVAAEDSSLLVFGDFGDILRSVDGGLSWAGARHSDISSLNIAISVAGGQVVAMGNHGRMARNTGTLVPTSIERISETYGLSGRPVLEVTLRDPDALCSDFSCISVEARSADDEKRHVVARTLPRDSIEVVSPVIARINVNPAVLSAKQPDAIFVRVRVLVPGSSRFYPAGETFLPIENHPDPIWKHGWFISLAGVVAVSAALYVLLWLAPLGLLGLTARDEALALAPKAGIPGLSELALGMARLLLLPMLVRHPRVTTAWLAKYGNALAQAFERDALTSTSRIPPFFALPVENAGGDVVTPSPVTLAPFFASRRGFIQIVGQGGAGKTRLAIELARWLRSGALTGSPVGVIFLDEDCADFGPLVQLKINAILGEDTPPLSFVKALLAKGALCLIVDRISERQTQTRAALASIYQTNTPKWLVCTTRIEITVAGAESVVLRTRPLDSTTLLAFLAAQLQQENAIELFPGLADQSVLVHQLARQITVDKEELPITPLLVRIFVQQAIDRRLQGTGGVEGLPANVPEAYFQYVDQLDAARHTSQFERIDNKLLRTAATLVAYAELGDDFRPKPIRRSMLETLLQSDARLTKAGGDLIARMEENGLLDVRSTATEDTVKFILDPLAECLAAYEHARRCGEDAVLWQGLLWQVDARGDDAAGFLTSLRMVHAAYGGELKFPQMHFPTRPVDVATRSEGLSEVKIQGV